MAIYDLTVSIPTVDNIKPGDIINCPFSGTYKAITVPKGIYKLEVWGAQAGGNNSSSSGGYGGYSYGILTLTANTVLNLYSGGQGSGPNTSGGYNGGGSANSYGGSGGGGSDIRIASTSLYARVIVAGGGGGGGYSSVTGGFGGGVSGGQGGNGTATGGGGGTQTSGGSYNNQGTFGSGGSASAGGGGGGGWYGGASGASSSNDSAGGGGSGYVYTSSTFSNYPSGVLLNSAYYLTDANTIASPFLSPTGVSESGHVGSGYVRITVLGSGGGAKRNLRTALLLPVRNILVR